MQQGSGTRLGIAKALRVQVVFQDATVFHIHFWLNVLPLGDKGLFILIATGGA
jgi:hypothetical protein